MKSSFEYDHKFLIDFVVTHNTTPSIACLPTFSADRYRHDALKTCRPKI